MFRFFSWTFFALALLLLLGSGFVRSGAADSTTKPDKIQWESDLAVAEKKARETGRPLLIVFR